MGKLSERRETDIVRREELLHRVERITELPLLIFSFVMIPLLIGPFVWDMSPGEETTFLILDYFIWALFAIDLLIKLAITPRCSHYLRRH